MGPHGITVCAIMGFVCLDISVDVHSGSYCLSVEMGNGFGHS